MIFRNYGDSWLDRGPVRLFISVFLIGVVAMIGLVVIRSGQSLPAAARLDVADLAPVADQLAAVAKADSAKRLGQASQSAQATSSAQASESAQLTATVNYCRSFDPRQSLDIFVPTVSGGQTVPVVIYVHGGAWRGGDKADSLAQYYQPALNQAGIALVAINYRYLPKYVYPAAYEDMNCALTYIYDHAAEYHLDRTRMALMGESVGGEMVTYAALSKTDAQARWRPWIQAVVDFYGMPDLVPLANDLNYDDYVRRWLGPDYQQVEALASPLRTYSNTTPPPFLIFHGTGDTMVPYQQSVDLVASLTKRGGQASLVELPGEGHGFAMWHLPLDWYIRRQVVGYLSWRFDHVPSPDSIFSLSNK